MRKLQGKGKHVTRSCSRRSSIASSENAPVMKDIMTARFDIQELRKAHCIYEHQMKMQIFNRELEMREIEHDQKMAILNLIRTKLERNEFGIGSAVASLDMF